MEEVITRRLENYVSERMRPVNERGKFSYTPQLILVDGGKGQLQSALKGLRKLQLEKDIPVAAIAKKHEEIFLPGKRKPIQIPRGSEALYLL